MRIVCVSGTSGRRSVPHNAPFPGLASLVCMDTQLWRWNEIVQVCTALLLTLFFLVLMRTTRRSGLSIWVFAWLAHFAALVIAVLFAITPHVVLAPPAGARLAYLALECLFVVLLSIGAAHLARTPFLRLELSRVLLAVLVYSLVLGMVAQTPDMLEVLMSVTGAQVLLRWALQHNVVAIPKSARNERIEENAALYDFELDANEMARLDALDEDYRTTWDPTRVR